jgi:hypothetical protein
MVRKVIGFKRLIRVILVCMCSYLESFLILIVYTFLILGTYHPDTLYLRAQGREGPWPFFEARRGPQSKKSGKHWIITCSGTLDIASYSSNLLLCRVFQKYSHSVTCHVMKGRLPQIVVTGARFWARKGFSSPRVCVWARILIPLSPCLFNGYEKLQCGEGLRMHGVLPTFHCIGFVFWYRRMSYQGCLTTNEVKTVFRHSAWDSRKPHLKPQDVRKQSGIWIGNLLDAKVSLLSEHSARCAGCLQIRLYGLHRAIPCTWAKNIYKLCTCS